MSVTATEILKNALTLPESERIRLATELMDSVDESLPGLFVDEPGFLAEIERRANDPSPGTSWEEVQLSLKAKLNK